MTNLVFFCEKSIFLEILTLTFALTSKWRIRFVLRILHLQCHAQENSNKNLRMADVPPKMTENDEKSKKIEKFLFS